MQVPPTPMTASDKGAVLSVCHSANGKLLASAGQGGEIQILETASGETLHVLMGFGESISSVCFAPRSHLLAAAERRDSTIRLWEIPSSSSETRDAARSEPPQEVRCMHAQNFGGVNCVAFSCDGTMILAAYGNVTPDRDGSDDLTATPARTSNAVMVWDTATGGLRMQIADCHNGAVTSVACNPTTARFAASGSIDGSIKIWDVVEGKETMLIVGHSGAVWCVSYSPDARVVASASSDRMVKVWSASTGENVVTIRGHTKIVTSVQMTADGTKLLSCSSDRTVRLWDASSGVELACAEGDGAFTAVSVGSGYNVAVGCASGELYLLDMTEVADNAAPGRENARESNPSLQGPATLSASAMSLSSRPTTAAAAAVGSGSKSPMSMPGADSPDSLRRMAATGAGVEMDRIRKEHDRHVDRKEQEKGIDISMRREHDEQVSLARKEYHRQMENMRKEHERQMESIRREQDRLIEHVRKHHEEHLDTIKKQHERLAQSMREQHEQELETVRYVCLCVYLCLCVCAEYAGAARTGAGDCTV
jgi:hypothetical protein